MLDVRGMCFEMWLLDVTRSTLMKHVINYAVVFNRKLFRIWWARDFQCKHRATSWAIALGDQVAAHFARGQNTGVQA